METSEKIACTNASEWKIVGLTPKACGGYYHFIAYHTSVEGDLLPKINNYNAQVEAFNKKWNIISDCSLAIMPKSVECVNGEAVLKN